MELNNLLRKIKHQEEEPKKFLSLELTDEIAQVAVWHVRDSRTEVVKIGTLENWNGEDSEKLISSIDTSLSKAVEGLDPEPSEVILGLPFHWVSEQEIVENKKKLIKKICQDLELKPLGFVVITESLVKYLKLKEGTPTTSIIVHVEDSDVTVSLVKLGRIEATHAVGRSEDIARDVEEGISRFNAKDNLPSRIIVFNGTEDLEEIVQNLNSYDWQTKFNFLHVPKIESLPKDSAISAIAVAGGGEVAKSIGFEINFDEKPENPPSTSTPPKEPRELPEEFTPPIEPTSSTPLEELGFVEDRDIADAPAPQNDASPSAPSPVPPSSKRKLTLPSFTLPKLKLKLPRVSFPKHIFQKFGKKRLLVTISLTLTLLLSFIASAWLLPKTSITLYLTPKNLEQSLTLTVSTKISSLDAENSIIPARQVSKEISGSETTDTTGTKLIGDPGKGEVTIYNRTSLEKTFPKGTEISFNKLIFTLDSDVTIASGSASNDYIGKSTVAVTASQIGPESNLPSGTEFAIENFSKDSFVAKNTTSFSGGTSQEIRVASEEDASRLLETLTGKLEETAIGELTQNANEQTGVFIQRELTEVVTKNFTPVPGTESNKLNLNLTLIVKGLEYSKSDVESLINSSVESNLPEGYTRTSLPISVETSSAIEGDEEVTLEANVKVKLLPSLNGENLRSSLKGLRGGEIERILSEIPGFSRADILITPRWLPPRWKSISRSPGNITVTVQPVE